MKAHKFEDGDMNAKRLHEHEIRMSKLEIINESINASLQRIEKRFDSLEKKIDNGFEIVNSRMWQNFYWTLSGFIGLLGLLAHSFKWI